MEPAETRHGQWGGAVGGGERGAEVDPDIQMTLGRKTLSEGWAFKPGLQQARVRARPLLGRGGLPGGLRAQLACGDRGVQAWEVALLRKVPLPHARVLVPAPPRHQPTCLLRVRTWARKKLPMGSVERLLTNLTSKQKQTPGKGESRGRGGTSEDPGVSRHTLLSTKRMKGEGQLRSASTIV